MILELKLVNSKLATASAVLHYDAGKRHMVGKPDTVLLTSRVNGCFVHLQNAHILIRGFAGDDATKPGSINACGLNKVDCESHVSTGGLPVKHIQSPAKRVLNWS